MDACDVATSLGAEEDEGANEMSAHHIWIGYLSAVQRVHKKLINDESIRHASHTWVQSPQDLEGWQSPITIHICWPGLRTLTKEQRKSYQRLITTIKPEYITIMRHK